MQDIEDKLWLNQQKDNRHLTDLIKYWKLAHSMTFSNGEKFRVL
ncbi:hypothetical protein [Photobacterium kishitanii]|nr:hypothetical protein [Photobacterium kishitanii]